jgi:ribosomal 30S subunit maturation factor RimM
MIPVVEQFVLAVDIAKKVITVRDVPGLRVDEL